MWLHVCLRQIHTSARVLMTLSTSECFIHINLTYFLGCHKRQISISHSRSYCKAVVLDCCILCLLPIFLAFQYRLLSLWCSWQWRDFFLLIWLVFKEYHFIVFINKGVTLSVTRRLLDLELQEDLILLSNTVQCIVRDWSLSYIIKRHQHISIKGANCIPAFQLVFIQLFVLLLFLFNK